MAKIFDPKQYVEGYTKASDIEHISDLAIHPKSTGNPFGYVPGERIVAIAGTTINIGGVQVRRGALYHGPGSDENLFIHRTDRDPDTLNVVQEVTFQLLGHTMFTAMMWKLRDGTQLSDLTTENLLKIHRSIQTLMEIGINVYFWKVPSAENQECYRMQAPVQGFLGSH
ncbi:hypothetical protein F5Y16DRAFT_398365 [Xylariaceae sp. FL0255]|nr:hypothetical protein F5Y16DRAFT_398365 [Xylariaceae sp. FL0255]